MTLLLDKIADIKKYVDIVNILPKAEVESSSQVVDTRSVLGLFTLDLTKPITIKFEDDTPVEVLNKLVEFSVKEV